MHTYVTYTCNCEGHGVEFSNKRPVPPFLRVLTELVNVTNSRQLGHSERGGALPTPPSRCVTQQERVEIVCKVEQRPNQSRLGYGSVVHWGGGGGGYG